MDATAPVVEIQSPSGSDSTQASPATGSAYAIVIDARDEVGVVRVDVHVDGGPAVTVSGPPWELTWDTTGLPEGSSHSMWATASDAAGNVGASDTVYARVFNAGPKLEVTEPAADALVKGTITVTAQFVGTTPEIKELLFLDGARTLGSIAAPPWSLELPTETLTPGDHFLSAQATTVLDQTGVSLPVRIRVNNEIPVVAVAFPPDRHRIATRGTLILSGSATDGLEGILPDERLQWTSSISGPLGSGPYLRIANLPVGTHSITAAATNSWGTVGASTFEVEVLASPTYSYGTIHTDLFEGRACIGCHAPGTDYFRWSMLDLRTYESLMAGGRYSVGYETVVPCRPDSSLVWNKLTEDVPWVGEPMPPRAEYPAVPADILEKLRTWILEGAPPDAP